MMCSGKLDFSANPLNVVLTGPHASKRMAVGALGYRRAAIRPMIQRSSACTKSRRASTSRTS
jgi:hypothetical protein